MARPRTDLRARLVRAARSRFLEKGVDGASLRDIARVARTNIGMVYYHFKSKDELFLAVIEDVYPKLLADLREALGPALTFDERLAGGYARMAALSDDEYTVLRIIVREALVSSQRLGRVLRRFTEGHVGLVVAAVAEAAASGALRDDVPPAALLPCIVGLGMGILFARRLRDATREGKAEPPFPPPEPAEVARVAAALLWRGAAAERKRRRSS